MQGGRPEAESILEDNKVRDAQFRRQGEVEEFHRYGALMREIKRKTRLWTDSEAGEVLRHQLEAEVAAESGSVGLEAGYVATLGDVGGDQSIKTFRDLLVHPRPPEDLLQLAKQFAKAHLSSGSSPLPREVAQVLYFGAIVSGLLQGYRGISTLTSGEVRRGVEWAMHLSWIDEDLLRLFRRFLGSGEDGQRVEG